MLDYGDTVLKALQEWDKCKSGEWNLRVKKSLENIEAQCEKLKKAKTTNKRLHKESIGYMDHYIALSKKLIDLCVGSVANKSADDLFKSANDNNLPKSIIAQLKQLKVDSQYRYYLDLLFVYREASKGPFKRETVNNRCGQEIISELSIWFLDGDTPGSEIKIISDPRTIKKVKEFAGSKIKSSVPKLKDALRKAQHNVHLQGFAKL